MNTTSLEKPPRTDTAKRKSYAMTHYEFYCPVCGEEAIARVNGMPTDLVDGYTYHSLDGYSYIHKRSGKSTVKNLSSRTDTHED